MGEKTVKSFSVDEDIAELLSERDDLNASAVVNKFLREYIAGGRGEEAALEIRLSHLDEEIAELEKDLERKRRERDRLQDQLDSRRSELRDYLLEVEAKIRADEFPAENVQPDNPAIQRWASEAGVPADRFVNELQARL